MDRGAAGLSPPGVDKLQARRAFSRAASGYDEVAVLQREVAQRMTDRLDWVRLDPGKVLDLGCGTGTSTELLLQRYKRATVLALDFALPMLNLAARRGRWLHRPRCLCADAESLPLRPGSVDLAFSNLTFQWCNDLTAVFGEILRVLRPGGLLMFSTFGPGTLQELRESWAAVDDGSHVSTFVEMHDLGDALLHGQFDDPVVDAERLTLTYPDVGSLMRDLKAMGAHNVTSGRSRGLTGKRRLEAMRREYERYRRDDYLPATFEVVYGHAWAPTQRRQGNEVTIPVSVLSKPGP